jgi:hypothetical protein
MMCRVHFALGPAPYRMGPGDTLGRGLGLRSGGGHVHLQGFGRQALRDFEYLRDTLGAPLVYSVLHRGYTYTSHAFTLPGVYVTGEQRQLLSHLAATCAPSWAPSWRRATPPVSYGRGGCENDWSATCNFSCKPRVIRHVMSHHPCYPVTSKQNQQGGR